MAFTARKVGNFEMLTPVENVLPMRTLPVADPTLLDPNDANSLLQGEILVVNASYQLERPAGVALDKIVGMGFILFHDQGSSDGQVIADPSANVIIGGPMEFKTRIFDGAGPALGDVVCIQLVSDGGTRVCGGLGIFDPAVDYALGVLPFGFVTRTAASNDGWLQVVRL